LYSEKIAGFANGFVKDGSVVWLSAVYQQLFFFFSRVDVMLWQILTHSHSRVVMKALLHAHQRKRISVYVTEGVKSKFTIVTHLTARGRKLNREDWGKLRRQVNE